MLRRTTLKEKTAHKLVADPFAQEKHWLPACADMRNDAARVSKPLQKLRSGALLLSSIVVSAVIAVLYTLLVDAGHDWGYNIIDKFWGQPEDVGIFQGVFALISLVFVIFPATFGLAFGAISSHLNRTGRSWFLMSITAMVAVGIGWINLTELSHQAGDGLDTILIVAACMAVAIGFTITGLKIGSWSYSELRKRLRARRMFVYSLLTLIPFAVLNFTQAHMPWQAELTGYFLSIALSAYVAASLARAKNTISAFLAGSFVILPILFANLLNVSTNFLLSPYFEQDQWQGLASAVSINVVALAAIFVGGTTAAILNRRQLNPTNSQNLALFDGISTVPGR